MAASEVTEQLVVRYQMTENVNENEKKKELR